MVVNIEFGRLILSKRYKDTFTLKQLPKLTSGVHWRNIFSVALEEVIQKIHFF